jgi:DNA invertase Pin-like site-specific DNA recombinase
VEGTLTKAWSLGAKVFTVDLGEVISDDPDDPTRTALRQMVGVFAQLERGMIAARMRAGRREKGARGGFTGGAPRFGVRADDRELVADPDEQATLHRMVELRADGASLQAIAETLDAEGRRPKRGTRWHPTTVARVLSHAEVGQARAS